MIKLLNLIDYKNRTLHKHYNSLVSNILNFFNAICLIIKEKKFFGLFADFFDLLNLSLPLFASQDLQMMICGMKVMKIYSEFTEKDDENLKKIFETDFEVSSNETQKNNFFNHFIRSYHSIECFNIKSVLQKFSQGVISTNKMFLQEKNLSLLQRIIQLHKISIEPKLDYQSEDVIPFEKIFYQDYFCKIIFIILFFSFFYYLIY